MERMRNHLTPQEQEKLDHLFDNYMVSMFFQAISTGSILATSPFLSNPDPNVRLVAKGLVALEGATTIMSAIVARRISGFMKEIEEPKVIIV